MAQWLLFVQMYVLYVLWTNEALFIKWTIGEALNSFTTIQFSNFTPVNDPLEEYILIYIIIYLYTEML